MNEQRKITKQLFKDIVAEYKDIEDKHNFQYKVKHSSRVAKNAEKIAVAEALDVDFSYIIGLLHDIGRFEQTRMELKFNDDHVFDHADFSEEMISKNKAFLSNFTKEEVYILKKALKNHNKYKIEDGLDEKTLAYCKMIRDADKVDILEYYNTLPYKLDHVYKEVFDDYNSGKLVRYKFVNSSQARLISGLAYRHDIYYQSTKEIMKPTLIEMENKSVYKRLLRKFD